MTAQPVVDAIHLLRYIGSLAGGNHEFERRCVAAAKELEQFEAIRASFHGPGTCRRCGGDLGEYAGRGRRRTYCTTCRPSTVREKTEKFDKPGG